MELLITKRKINFFGSKDLQVTIYSLQYLLKNASLSEKNNFWH